MSKTKNTVVATATATPAPENGSRAGAVPVPRRDSTRALWAALRAHPDSTTAALADLAGIGQSTARRLLAQWETAGCAQSHTDPESPRAAKTWTQGAGTPAAIEPDPAAPAPPAEPEPAPAAPADPGPAEPATPEPVSSETAAPVASSPETTEPAPESATATTAAGVPTLHSAEARALWEALETHPGSTSAELAKAARIDIGAVRHLLTEWELAGAAWAATDPGKSRTKTVRWTAGAKTDQTPAAPEPVTTEPAGTAPADPATPEPVAPEPATPAAQATPADPTPDTTAETAVAAPTGDETATVAPHPPAAADNGAAVDAESTAERLPAGALRGQVEDFLHENPGKEFTPHQIGKALARSSGAVHNALVKLTDGGTARQTSTAPKKFTLAS
ncbi:hypothetical protein [Nocardia sp. FDAARGOS_372]|uniref:hypothetical protein n=1 Tax=Nocardia sp. FDAARGOS_372 TaxID=2018066 RepID=UPI000D1F1325|nr:hypothetical protein [Nocardia sp. FDAARGOS_372]